MEQAYYEGNRIPSAVGLTPQELQRLEEFDEEDEEDHESKSEVIVE